MDLQLFLTRYFGVITSDLNLLLGTTDKALMPAESKDKVKQIVTYLANDLSELGSVLFAECGNSNQRGAGAVGQHSPIGDAPGDGGSA